ncbi:UCH domain-containing protein [Cephalotus follicularis]|uniref:Ubiquitin carboxyl-terminal hydrolase n=1 Tax=Cephalotus follicularis TaxID=3775 RepID=A0A1Q3D7K5_CEPFO|nr:UCH domain-containing protein [Cephalotus follicularis]
MKTGVYSSVKGVICNIKHGYKAFFHVKWASTSGFHISVASLLGATGFVLAIRDYKFRKWFTKEENSLGKKCLVPGLQNLGNSCFLNVILQALASCLYFKPFLQNVIDECSSLLAEEHEESLPLTVALAALLEELHTVGEQRVVLTPRKVMLVLALYVQNFNLTSQQDAAEAFHHLLFSLREEISDYYRTNQSSLADVLATSNCRILTTQRRENESEQERWHQHYLGPFDGILSSILTCQSCSTEISLDFQFFHSLPLSPMLDKGSAIHGCTLEDSMKQFTVAEQVENYRCSHCWHIAAIKYLSSIGENKTEIEKLRRCSGLDSCDCQSSLNLEKLPWSNHFSRTLKQLSIAHCPKILCIQLQRASINEFGELVKLEGHVAFPLILDILPFMTIGVEIKIWKESVDREQVKLQYQNPSHGPNHLNLKLDVKMLNCVNGLTSKVVAADEFEGVGGKNSTQSEDCCRDLPMPSDDKERVRCQLSPSGSYLYRLVSVVEHFGRVGSGHYIVHRSVSSESDMEGPNEHFESFSRWFCISDSDVFSVSEKDVLAAEASLLFYERIVDD